jgi:hypothetical protein
MIAEVLVDDGSYIDPNRHGVGYQEIDALMSSAQNAFPGYPSRHELLSRVSWS